MCHRVPQQQEIEMEDDRKLAYGALIGAVLAIAAMIIVIMAASIASI